MSSKKLMTGVTILMVVMLATMGVAYGFWTDTLVIGGTVQSGDFEVQFVNLWWSDTNCSYVMDATNHTLTITANNAYPGFWCEGSVEVKNTGSIPVVIQPVVVSSTGPDYWDVYPYYTAAMTLQPGVTGAGTSVNFTIPTTEQANEGAVSTLTVTFEAKQVNAP